jgi:hypothetical protein
MRWCIEKDRALKYQYGVSFEVLLQCRKICTMDHPSRHNQNLMLFEREGYVWVIPFVIGENEIFLKALYPSRKYTRLYMKGDLNEECQDEDREED